MTEQDSIEDSVGFSFTCHKIVFVGDEGVGKTTIINRIVDNPFNDLYEPSIGVDYMSKNIKYHGQNVKLQIWDISGQEKYKGLFPSFVRNSSLVFLVYDISSKTSFENIPNWINFIKTIENTSLVLCGNKTDLENRKVKKKEGEELAKKEGILFYEVSSKTGYNISNMLYNVIADLPIFSNVNAKKKNLLKELMEENGVENIQEELESGPAEEINNLDENQNTKIKKENEINDLKNKIKELENELNLITNENMRLKKLEKIYNDSKKIYEEEIQSLKSMNNELTNKLKLIKKNDNPKYENNAVSYIKIIDLMEEIKNKDNEIKELKSRLPFELNKGEKLMTIIFTSDVQKIHYSLICKNTDKFNKIENMLYDEYPEYQESENYFTVNGNKIMKSKTTEENNIKFSDTVILYKYE